MLYLFLFTVLICSMWNFIMCSGAPIIGQFADNRYRPFDKFRCAWCCGYPRTVLSLEQGLTILFVYSISFSSLYYCTSLCILHTHAYV